jgi:hypothetical protein
MQGHIDLRNPQQVAVLNPNTTRVDFIIGGQKNCGFNSAAPKIDHSFPKLLEGHTSAGAYETFCIRADEVLEEIAVIKKSMARRLCRLSGICIAFSISVALYYKFFAADDWPTWIPIVFIVGSIILPCLCFILVFIDTHGRIAVVMTKKLEGVLSDFCCQSSTLTGELKSERRYTNRRSYVLAYIDFTVESSSPYGLESGYGASPVLSPAYTGAPSGGTNHAQRLADLEGIRSLISPEEYEQKRRDILSSV